MDSILKMNEGDKKKELFKESTGNIIKFQVWLVKFERN